MIVFLDDLLIYSSSHEEQLQHLRTVLSRLKQNELYVGRSKCEIMIENTEFLDLRLGAAEVSVGEDMRQIVQECPKPKNLTDLRIFLGLLQRFWRFIKDFLHVASPRTDLTPKGIGTHK